MISLDTVRMPGSAAGVVAAAATGPLFVTSRTEPGWGLSAVDLDGTVRWQRPLTGRTGRMRGGHGDTVWVSRDDVLTEIAADGSVCRELTVDQGHQGTFAVLPDGFLVVSLAAPSHRPVPPGTCAVVARYDEDGGPRWSTSINLDHLVLRERRRRTVRLGTPEALLVSGDRIVVSFEDGSSGIGATHFLDLATGGLVATTEPGPLRHKAVVGPGEFLIGMQGYGAFHTTRYTASGRKTREWDSHAQWLVDRHGDIRGPESENVLPSRSRFRGLAHDGTLRDGPRLNAYYTTYPALDEDGTAVFWRGGKLLAVDVGFELRELCAVGEERDLTSRILLMEDGLVVFALSDQLVFCRGTGLGPLDSGVWPCGDGDLKGSSVALPG